MKPILYFPTLIFRPIILSLYPPRAPDKADLYAYRLTLAIRILTEAYIPSNPGNTQKVQ